MPFEPIFEDINLTQLKENKKEHVKVECKTDIQSEGISKILNVSARSVITKTQTNGINLEYQGKVTFFVCYLSEDGQIEKCECGSEFKGVLSSENVECCKAVVISNVEKTETDISGVRLCVNAFISLDVILSECKKINALTGGEKLITSKNEFQCVKGLGQRESLYSIEEEWTVDHRVEDVLCQRAEAVVTSVQCGVGTIIVDGEVLLSAILLQSREKRDIIKENKVLPFRAEIECEDAMPNLSATAYVSAKSFKSDISVDEQGDRSQVNANVVLSLIGEVYVEESMFIVQDAFSTEEDVELEKEEVCFSKPCDVRSENKEITLVAVTSSLPAGTSLLATANEKVEIISYATKEDYLEVTGVVFATAFLRDGEGQTFTRKLESPFTTTINCKCDKDCDYRLRAWAYKSKAKLVTETQIEINVCLYFCAYPFEKCAVKLIKNAKSVGKKQPNEHAISIYIPCEGEDLWTLSKRLNICPEQLVKANQDLQFPLSGKERIVVYRQK